MKNNYIQSYSIEDILNRYERFIVDKRLAVVEIGPKHSQYFVIGKPYTFASFGLILIKSGECEITINLEPTKVKKNDILVVLPQQFFEIIQYTKDFSVQAFFASGELFLDAGFHLKSNNLIQFFSSQYPKILSLNSHLIKELNYHMKRLNKLVFDQDNMFTHQLILHHFSILMYELGHFYNKRVLAKTEKKTLRKEELTKNFLLLVSSHFKKERSVQFYADHMFISRKHLTKVITEIFGKTPKDIIVESIILEAKILLKNPNNSVTSVASELNFQDVALFSKFFKNSTGSSPREFKLIN
ncbi:helix-turn-helix domain-containing protein [Myroides sp. WP-1]|uniref:helix-turn-helix domain-containing protein n=1 Tax=Myroides sp. WP-1 TaxID=2759944 RepID=UPI0015FE0C54|nr:AraC family transcriptional regulator [Myroides sp. WP-1]